MEIRNETYPLVRERTNHSSNWTDFTIFEGRPSFLSVTNHFDKTGLADVDKVVMSVTKSQPFLLHVSCVCAMLFSRKSESITLRRFFLFIAVTQP